MNFSAPVYQSSYSPATLTFGKNGKKRARLASWAMLFPMLIGAGGGVTGLGAANLLMANRSQEASAENWDRSISSYNSLNAQLQDIYDKKTALSTAETNQNNAANDLKMFQEGVKTLENTVSGLNKDLKEQQRQLEALSKNQPFQFHAVASTKERKAKVQAMLPELNQVAQSFISGRGDLGKALAVYGRDNKPVQVEVYDKDTVSPDHGGEAYCDSERITLKIAAGDEFTEDERAWARQIVVHEVAHALACLGVQNATVVYDGNLETLPGLSKEEQKVFETERDKVLHKIRHKKSDISDYALKNNTEALATFMQTLMTEPWKIYDASPELYNVLMRFLNFYNVVPQDGNIVTVKVQNGDIQNPVFSKANLLDVNQKTKTDHGNAEKQLKEKQAALKNTEASINTLKQKIDELKTALANTNEPDITLKRDSAYAAYENAKRNVDAYQKKIDNSVLLIQIGALTLILGLGLGVFIVPTRRNHSESAGVTEDP